MSNRWLSRRSFSAAAEVVASEEAPAIVVAADATAEPLPEAGGKTFGGSSVVGETS